MPLARIQFNDTGSPSGAYTLLYNPTNMEWPDSKNIIKIEMVDSETAVQNLFWDSREITMVWENYTTAHTAFVTQMTTLRSYIGLKKYINLNDIGSMVKSDSSTWKGPYRIIDCYPVIQKGTYRRWETWTLILQRTAP